MAYERFLIAPIQSGLQTNVKPWIIADDAFARLNNAYVWRGRVRKRFGAYLMNQSLPVGSAQTGSRLCIQPYDSDSDLVATDGSGNISDTLNSEYTFALGQSFSIGNAIFTIHQASGALYSTTAATGAFNISTGVLTISGATPSTALYWYPSLPVMGLLSIETTDIESEQVVAFDTVFSYTYVGGGWEQQGLKQWTGSDSQFFSGATYRGTTADNIYFFVVNNNVADGIAYWYNGASDWTTITPNYNAASNTIMTARIVIPFKNRLVLLNTTEGIGMDNTPTSFVNRARWSQDGDPTASGAWLQPPGTYGAGGWNDAPTKQEIIAAQIIKDRLIVYFEYSTYELVFTGNQNLPFIWQQINNELGSESTFSVVPFDKFALAIGNVGVHSCNGANVERIDAAIPDEIFNVSYQNNGLARVYGIRDYYTEMVYWTLPFWNQGINTTYWPNTILAYNYENQTWGLYDDSITCFGYFNIPDFDTWEDYDDRTWGTTDNIWNSAALQPNFQTIVAGNQQGWVFVIDRDASTNCPALSITTISNTGSSVTITSYNHNLVVNDWIQIASVVSASGFMSSALNGNIYQVLVATTNTFTINVTPIYSTDTYAGGGTIQRVSQVDILTKQYNPFVNKGVNVTIGKVDFLVEKTDTGSVTVDYWPSSSEVSLVQDGASTGAIMGTSVLETTPYPLYPLEATQERLWHPLYFGTDGECIQFRIYYTNDQMTDPNVVFEDFQLHAMALYAQATSRLQ